MTLQLLISGISLGSVYALIAVGFAIVFSILRFSNFAHGGMISACAFIGYFFSGFVPNAAAVLCDGSVYCSLRRCDGAAD